MCSHSKGNNAGHAIKRPPSKRRPMICAVCTAHIKKQTREHLKRHRDRNEMKEGISDEEFEEELRQGKIDAQKYMFEELRTIRKQQQDAICTLSMSMSPNVATIDTTPTIENNASNNNASKKIEQTRVTHGITSNHIVTPDERATASREKTEALIRQVSICFQYQHRKVINLRCLYKY